MLHFRGLKNEINEIYNEMKFINERALGSRIKIIREHFMNY